MNKSISMCSCNTTHKKLLVEKVCEAEFEPATKGTCR